MASVWLNETFMSANEKERIDRSQQMDRSWISSRSDDTMVAVGFNPRGGGDIARRRGATLERSVARPKADSSVAARRGSVFPFVRGLKPTATVIASLCEADLRYIGVQKVRCAPRKGRIFRRPSD